MPSGKIAGLAQLTPQAQLGQSGLVSVFDGQYGVAAQGQTQRRTIHPGHGEDRLRGTLWVARLVAVVGPLPTRHGAYHGVVLETSF
ncbi:MAG: hypothetical protein QM805_29415 [Pseudomonas sp.]